MIYEVIEKITEYDSEHFRTFFVIRPSGNPVPFKMSRNVVTKLEADGRLNDELKNIAQQVALKDIEVEVKL